MSSLNTSLSGVVKKAEQQFSEAAIPSPRLDAEILLAYVLETNRTWLHTHPEYLLQGKSLQQFEALVARRLKREPVAYIVGKKEFYGREFIVTPDVLIPRPETESLIEQALAYCKKNPRSSVLDVGCGSGCIGITLKLECPDIDVTLCDISTNALGVARKNTEELGADTQFAESNLLSYFLEQKRTGFNLIVANLPYVDTLWETSPETAYEPDLALYANDSGLELIKQLIEQSIKMMSVGGLLLLEADPEQHRAIMEVGQVNGYKCLKADGYALILERQV